MNDTVVKKNEMYSFFKDTSELAAVVQSDSLGIVANAAGAVPGGQMAATLANKTEYWKWMGRNFSCLGKPGLIAERAEIGGGAAKWLQKQAQGKGYEWDYFNKLRNDPRNIFSRLELPDIPNQPGFDMAKIDINGKVTEYQNKAYISKNRLDLSNTPKDTIVVTNQEKAAGAADRGHKTVAFKKADDIKIDTQRRMEEAASGKAGQYTFGGVTGVMLKAGAIGFAVSASIEAITHYKRYKNGEIDGIEYLKTIALAGGHQGVVGAATAGILIPIQAAIITAGLATPIAIPIGFVIGKGIDKIVAPMFGRGDFAVQLAQAKYYNNLNQFYDELKDALEDAGESFRILMIGSIRQKKRFDNLQQQDYAIRNDLKKLGNEI